MNDVILSPSDFAFGFDQCKKCYYDKIVNKVKLNGMFPSVFQNLIDVKNITITIKTANI